MSNIQAALTTLLSELGFVKAPANEAPVRPTTGYQAAPRPTVRERVAAAPNTFSVTATDGTVITFEELPDRAGARVTIPGVGSKDLGVGAVLGLRDALVQVTRV